MAKPTPMTPDTMSAVVEQETTLNSRSVVKKEKVKKSLDDQTPLQIRIPASEVKSIKRAALEADQTISDFMLACFHAHMKM
jgi:hypothetical protein